MPAQPTARPTQRRHHLIDIENLVGGRFERILPVVRAYHGTGVVGPHDLVTVAGARRAAHRWVFDTPANWRKIICANTVDATDEALIDAGKAVWDLSGLVIGSGDGVFADLVTSAHSRPVPVTVVVADGKLSKRLGDVADRLIML